MSLRRLKVIGLCLLGGGLVAFSMPPWGWWPLAFVGLALLDHLMDHPNPKVRFRRAGLFALAWLMPATLWMWALTIPGYLVVGPIFAALFGLFMTQLPDGRTRPLALVGAVTLWEVIRWSVPFGGVPLATLAMSQVSGPLAITVRLLGPLMLVALTVAVGVAINAATKKDWITIGAAVTAVLFSLAVAAIAPVGNVVDTINVALVQGGGEQGTRAINTSTQVVFDRHVEASGLIEGPVDLIVWPENAIDTSVRLENSDKWDPLVDIAAEYDAILLAGVTEDVSDTAFVNSSVAVSPTGESLDRYEKQILVPFGETVPFRSIIEPLAPDYLPARDARKGRTDSVVETPVGDLGVVISWEVFFDTRGRAAVNDGGQIIINPTNGSSYWLTIVQTQQVASSKLRALESGRYVLQTSPTGFTAIVTPDGEVIDRTAVSEQAVVQGTVELREGRTIATTVGRLPMVILGAIFFVIPALKRLRRPHP